MTWWTDLRYALRTFRKNPAFTTFAVLTLGLGLGANTAIFSFLDGILLKPVPYPEPDQIVQIWEKPPRGLRNGVSALNFLDWQEQGTLFASMAARTGSAMTLTGSGAAPQQLRAAQVSAPYFDVFGLQAMLGRTFAPGEDQAGHHQVVVLSNRIWQTRFGGETSVIGRTVTLNGEGYTIIGVMPPGEFDRGFFEIWTPLVLRREAVTRNFHYLNVTARMKPGVTLDQAKTQMSAIAGAIAERFPDIKKDWGATVDRLVDRIVGDQLRLSLLVLMSAVGAVLLIGCANLANLLLARGTLRAREMALRAALGAGRGRLIRQLLTESLVLSMLGAAAGLVIGFGMFQVIRSLLPRFFLPSQATVGIDWRVMLFLSALAILTGVLFGLAPAFQGSRRDPADVLKEGGRGSVSSGARLWLRQSLVITEVALAFVLLVGAGLLIRSFQRLMLVDPGFDSTNVITMDVPLIERGVDGARLNAYLDELLLQVRAVPGVHRAAFATALPMQGWGFGMPLRLEREANEGSRRQGAGFKMITPDYFATLAMRLRKGRAFTERDVAGGVPVMVINETFAGRFFPKTDPIGTRIMVEQIIPGKRELGPEIPWEVIGIVADEKVGSLSDTSAGMYVPFAQSPVASASLIVKGTGDPTRFMKAVQQAVWNVNKDQALDNIRTLEEIKSESVAPNRLRTFLLGLFASLALVLAAIGIYGVLSYVTAQRTQELGVRAALGASSWDLIRLVIGNAAIPLGVGLALGVAGAFAVTKLLQTLLFEVTPTDPVTMITVGVLLAGVGMLACYIPARRASRIDPMTALRQE